MADQKKDDKAYKTGYQLGLAEKEEEFNLSISKYETARTLLADARGSLIERTHKSIANTLQSIGLLSNSLKSHLAELEKEQIGLLKTLSIELATIESAEGDAEGFIKEFRGYIKDAYMQHKKAVESVIRDLNEKVKEINIGNSTQELQENIKKHMDEEIKNIADGQINFQLGYNKGKAIATQISRLTTNGVSQQVRAIFKVNSTSGPAPHIVEFDSQGSTEEKNGIISKFTWDFGDRSTASGFRPTHTFTKIGSYKVKLTVNNNGVEDSDETIITVTEPIPLNKIIATPSEGKAPLIVKFTTQAALQGMGSALSNFNWDFGDGNSSNLANPSYIYNNDPNEEKTYEVTLTANYNGRTETSKTTIKVSPSDET